MDYQRDLARFEAMTEEEMDAEIERLTEIAQTAPEWGPVRAKRSWGWVALRVFGWAAVAYVSVLVCSAVLVLLVAG